MVKGVIKMHILSFFGHFFANILLFFSDFKSRAEELPDNVSFVIFVKEDSLLIADTMDYIK